MKFEIKDHYSLDVIFSAESESLKLCVQLAVSTKANLRCANLRCANLGGANLRGANLGEKIGKLKADGVISISPVGSREDVLLGFHSDKGTFIKTGCFTGTVDEFRSKVITTHGDNDFSYEYLGIANLIEFHFTKVRK